MNAAISLMTEKESAHANFADFAGVDESEPISNIEGAIVPSASTPISDMPQPPSNNESPSFRRSVNQRGSIRITPTTMAQSSPMWNPTPEWVAAWRLKLPLQTIMRLLQVLVPQVEKICIDKYGHADIIMHLY